MSHYDWDELFTYQADEYLVIARRNKGKTFGFRKKMVENFLRRGERWGQLVRTKANLPTFTPGYFEKLKADGVFPDYIFKTDNSSGYIAKKPKDDKEKPKWKKCCYFRAMSDFQNIKNETFVDVFTVGLDEAVADRRDKWHQYLPDEPGILASIVNSMSREDGRGEKKPPKLVLMGNSCDLSCPHLQHLGVRQKPKPGKSWWWGKTRLLDWVKDDEGEHMRVNTVSGRLAVGTSEEKVALYNDFDSVNGYLVGEKTQRAKYLYGVKYMGRIIGFWIDWDAGYLYATNKTVKNATIYALTKDDGDFNTLAMRRNEPIMKFICDCYYDNTLLFETDELREFTFDMMALLGLK